MPAGALPLSDAILELKSAYLTVPVLLLSGNDLSAVEAILREKIAQAPEFFHRSPLLIDLQPLTEAGRELDLEALLALLRSLDLQPVGLRGGNASLQAVALAQHLPLLPAAAASPVAQERAARKAARRVHEEREQAEVEAAPTMDAGAESDARNKLVSQPVRSGQRVYARGDLIVTATVSAGAELMAEGNIHVYGSLRGRALAGVRGDTDSRIFCHDLQAELLSIAGIYQLREAGGTQRTGPVQVSLHEQSLVIEPI